MGNEESQQAGGPGGPQPGGPMGAMGQQQQPRFGGPPGMTRPPGGMMGPPGGAGPPRGPAGGGGPLGVMGRPFAPVQQAPPPRQVGVQPWAEPPVPQPQRFRGPGSGPPMQQQQQQAAPRGGPQGGGGGAGGPRPLSAMQQQQQQMQQQQQAAAQMKLAEEEAGLDLSDLSEAEKAKILSVMARAQDLDQDYERHKRAKDEGGPAAVRLLCPLCQRADLAVETNKMCGDCGKDFCQKCGTFVPGEGRRSVWVCNTCSNRRKQQQEGGLTQAQKGVDSGAQRKDEAMTSSRMGQPFQQQQQQQNQQLQPQQQPQQPMMGIQQPQSQQPSVSLIGGVSTGGGTSLIGGVASSGGNPFVSGSLIPSVGGGGRGTIPRTVPLTALSQAPNNNNTGWNNNNNGQQQPQTIQQQQQMLMQQVTQGGMQQQQPQLQQQPMQQTTTTMMMQQHQQPMQQSTMLQPQQQQMNKQQPRTQQLQTKDEWSELSPILDVSPSFEAAEEELMEKCQQQGGGIPRATSGTISGMLADFNKALGLAATPTQEETRSLTGGHAQLQVPQHQPMGGATTTTMVSNTVMAPPLGSSSSTEMDQNQNLVQQQFQLQQQQLMIQQQQQVIAQQQQQLQQQMQFSSNAANIAQQQQEQQQAITVQQQQQQAMTQQQQQTQQQQPQSQRKVHRRLPQPAMDQMHAAIAAQTPKSKSARGYQRPVSPVLTSSRPHDGALLGVTPAPHNATLISPSARKDLEMSSSGKVRRRLPPVPLDQEPASASPLLRSKKLPLSASCGGGTGWASSHKHHRRTPQRTTSLDDGMALASSDLDFLRGLPSSSADSYLQLLTSTTTTTVTPPAKSVLDSIPSSIGMAGTGSLLVRRDLSAPHSLSSYLRGGVGSFLDPASSSRLPSYLVNLKQQLREELRSVTDIHRRRITDPDLSGLLSQWAGPSTDPLHLRSSPLPLPSSTRLPTSTPATMRRARHRRHASDTKLGTSSFLRDDAYGGDPLYRYNKFNMPFKSYEFESIDDHLRGGDFSGVYGSSAYTRGSSLLPLTRGGPYRRSSLTDAPPITLRDTPLASKSLDARRYNRDMARLRRHTDIGLVSSALGLDPYGRSSGGMLGGGAMLGSRRGGMRSWHPSPYVSSEDEDEREEKKAKIKAEIARRKERLLMQNTHDYRGGVGGGGLYEDRLYSSPLSLESGGSSQDEYDDYHHLLRRHPHASNTYPAAYGRRSHSVGGVGGSYGYPYDWGGEEDLPYDYPGGYDYSPLDNPLPMPLLPDMPTRSRKLLHELQHYPQQGDYGPPPPRTGGGGHHQSHHHHQSYHPDDDYRRPPPPLPPSQSSVDSRHSPRKAQQNPKGGQKYDFPVKRILLTRDPKDRSVSGNGLGMKVVGGKEIPGGRGEIGAYVARIYPGGVVETLGEVREGDQVLEWNGVCLTGKTYEEVQRIIASSGDEVEIVIRSDFNMLGQGPASTHPPATPPRRVTRGGDGGWGEQGNTRRDDYYHQGAHEEGGGGGGNMSPGRGQHRRGRQQRIVSPTHEKGDNAENKEKYRAENICGEIQLQVCHDSKVGILYVTIVRARNLVTSRDNSGLPDPYVICYLLPDRCFEHQRRTRYFSRCSRPEWKQTMVYPHVPAEDLRRRHLEVSVWNYDANGGPPEFLGEVIVDLKDASVIDEQSRWYKLHPHDPKKYPCPPSSAAHHPVKMARLNNPKILFDDDVRKSNHFDRRFLKHFSKKSNPNENYTKVSSQSWRLPALHAGNITAHPLLPQGCHAAVCAIL